jgi:hypothetical protein
MTNITFTERLSMAIMFMLGVSIIMTSLSLYNQSEILRNQDEGAKARDVLLHNTETLVKNIQSTSQVSQAEQTDAITKILDFINRTDVTLNQTQR